MRVSKDVIEEASLSSNRASSRPAEAIPNRAYLGQVETVTVVTTVTIVFVEIVIIDELLLALGITVTATAAASAAYDAAQAPATRAGVPRGTRKPH